MYEFRAASLFKMPILTLLLRINADDIDHRRFRKLQAHAFSEKALLSQEEILQGHVHSLLDKLNQEIAGPRKGSVSLDQWYNFTTFDVIGDLSFGESFHNVEKGEMHPQIRTLYQTLRANNFMRATQSFPAATRLLKAMIPKDLAKKRLDFINWANEKATTRMKSGSDRPDFMTYMLRNNLDTEEGGMTENELREAAGMPSYS
jgi:cytochrome P450